jgi:hypothetical protein
VLVVAILGLHSHSRLVLAGHVGARHSSFLVLNVFQCSLTHVVGF